MRFLYNHFSMRFRVGTRGSKLALKQTEIFVQMLKDKFPSVELEVVVIKTKGDKLLDAPPPRTPVKGLFVKDIEEELIKGNIDFAVHSLKDVPLSVPPGLAISAYLPREDPADVIVGMTKEEILEKLREERKVLVGTSSIRRQLIIREKLGEVEFVNIRGNVDTRIKKVKNKECDCIVIALAGLKRLGYHILDGLPYEVLDPKDFMYSPGQGIIAIETKIGTKAYELSRALDDPESRFIGEIERGILRSLGGGCSTPLGIYSKIIGNRLFIKFRLFGKPVSFEEQFELTPDILDKPEKVVDLILKEVSK